MSKSIRLNKVIREEIIENVMTSYAGENPAPPPVPDSIKGLHEAVVDWALEHHKKAIDQFTWHGKHYSNVINNAYRIGYNDHKDNTHWVHLCTKDTSSFCNESQKYLDSVYIPNVFEGLVINLSNPDTEIPKSIQAVIDNIEGTKKEVREAKKRVSDYEKAYNQYRANIEQVVYGVNTSNQLLEVWPEVGKFLPRSIINPSTINLPSVSIASLNSALGL